MVALALVSSIALLPFAATANPVPPPSSSENVLELTLVNLPLNGIILMLVLMAPLLFRFRPEPQEVKAHVLLVLVSVMVLSLLGAVIDLVAYNNGTPSTLSFTVAALAILLLYLVVTFRYLGRSLGVSLYTGLVFAVINAAFWTVLLGWDRPDLDRALELMKGAFFALLILFFVLLAAETFLLHMRPTDEAGRDMGPSRETTPEGAGSTARVWEAFGLLFVAGLITIATGTLI